MKNLISCFFLLFVALKGYAQISPEKWRADIEFLRVELPAKHVDLFSKISNKDFEKDLRTLSENLAGQSDLQIGLQLQAILSKAGDSHTRLELRPLMLKELPIPFGLGWYADGLYVSGTVKRFEQTLSKKVLKINGFTVKDALEKMGVFVGQDNEFTLRKDALPWFRFPTAIRLAGLGATDTLELLLENPDGQPETRKVYPLDISSRADMMPAKVQQQSKRDIRWQPTQSIFSMQWLAEDSVLYVQYNRCLSREMSLAMGDSAGAQTYPPFQPLSDSVVAFVQRTPGAKLFFDIRFNGGGGANDGINFAKRLAEIPTLNRKEKLFVAINLYTSSAAVQVATVFSQLTRATLLGDPPAMPSNHFGEARSFTLPNSGLVVFYSTKFMRMVKGNPAFLQPDVLLEMKYEDFRLGRDPVLDYVRRFGSD